MQMTTEQSEFRFLDPGPLVDGDLELVSARANSSCDTGHGRVPQYEFDLRLTGTTLKIGVVKLRVLLTDELKLSVHPVLAGYGGLLFRDGAKTPLRLVGAKPLGTAVILSYQPAYGER